MLQMPAFRTQSPDDRGEQFILVRVFRQDPVVGSDNQSDGVVHAAPHRLRAVSLLFGISANGVCTAGIDGTIPGKRTGNGAGRNMEFLRQLAK